MFEILLIIKREFLERVHTKSFVIGTLVVPLFFAAIFALPLLLGSERAERTLVVVDEAPRGVGERMIAALSTPRPDADIYHVERETGPFESVRERLTERVLEKEIDGFVVLPPDILETNQVVYRARNVANMDVLRDIDRAASSAVQTERLRQAGLDGAEVAALVRGVSLNSARITERGEEGGSLISTLITAYVVTMLIYMLVFFYGVAVMRSVLEEKTNRISEVIVSSVKSTHLMIGKIVGVSSVALLQVGIWGFFIAVAASQTGFLADRFGIPPEALQALQIDPLVALALVAFFLVGFFLYSAMFAALGAAISTEQEGQSMQMILIVPLIVPLITIMPITAEPLGRLATLLGMIPLTSPVVMPMRLAITGLPWTEVAASLAVLTVSLALVVWVAAKIYRVGILSTGKKASLRDLGRWIRMA